MLSIIHMMRLVAVLSDAGGAQWYENSQLSLGDAGKRAKAMK